MKKILIANRGEIACRVAKTCRDMGIMTVAVFSDADRNAQHVKACDEAYYIGPAAPSESYLKMTTLIEVAKKSGAEGIHPGYGFLSENAEFCRLCDQNNLIFIGPNVNAIEQMGSKSVSKKVMEKADVPLIPGYHGDEQAPALLKQEAEKIGYPVMIKASAGGGGKGMRMVEAASQFDEALDSAKREAINAFGDDHILIEKFIVRPRHIEVQVFGDQLGNVVYLFERDCSIQRRHQKVVEEAPAPGLTDQQRSAFGDAAVKAARAIGYYGAGTVEFIMSADGQFFFMEMNTRLQVEHPVTELITGEDLVAWQIMVARGLPLPKSQQELVLTGHALEVRWYAENPDQEFLPSTGTLEQFWLPEPGRHARYDLGVAQGDEITTHYDPMIGKLIVWGESREQACQHMQQLLSSTRVMGIQTNLDYLERIISHPSFLSADVHTGFLEQHGKAMTAATQTPEPEAIVFAAVALLLGSGSVAVKGDPWVADDGWRMNLVNNHPMHLTMADGQHWDINCEYLNDHSYCFSWDEQRFEIQRPELEAGYLRAEYQGRILRVPLLVADGRVQLYWQKQWELELEDPFADVNNQNAGPQKVVAPMPGRLLDVRVAAGDQVFEGQVLAIMEAMKMEHSIRAQQDGVVGEVYYVTGDQVVDGAELLTFVRQETEEA